MEGVFIMKRKSKIWIVSMLSTVILAGAVWVGSVQGPWILGEAKAVQNGAAGSTADKSLISVTGHGEIEVEPDVAYISLGVETEGKTANEAQQENAKVFAALEKVLTEKYEVDKKELKTTNFQVNPKYNYQDREEPKIVGYTASHMVQVTYRKLEEIGSLLDDASKAGANRIHNIQFSTEKTEQYQLEALEKAMGNAKVKADTIAKTMNKSIKGAVYVSDSGTSGGNPSIRGFANESAKMSMDSAGGSTSISGGQLKITAQVNVDYEF
jgi:uncharacterized protein YggE